jgi:hypothetical protein
MKDVISFIITGNTLYEAVEHADDQTQKLALKVLRELRERLSVDQGTLYALRRLLGVAERGKEWSPDLVRNNIFKAAHDLGLDLPSSSF